MIDFQGLYFLIQELDMFKMGVCRKLFHRELLTVAAITESQYRIGVPSPLSGEFGLDPLG